MSSDVFTDILCQLQRLRQQTKHWYCDIINKCRAPYSDRLGRFKVRHLNLKTNKRVDYSVVVDLELAKVKQGD
jgi:hypothetical protein